MRIELTTVECRWLVDLANKAKIEAAQNFEESRHPILELRRDNMADLESKLNTAITKHRQRMERSAR